MEVPRQPAPLAMSSAAAAAEEPGGRVVADSTCLGCGCLCDDIRVVVRDGKIVATENTCSLGTAWFAEEVPETSAGCRIDGQAAPFDQALDRAAEILARARYPLVCGLSDATCQAQRLAAAIADRLGACLDSRTSSTHAPALLAVSAVGEVTATLGEVANRSDIVIFWGTDPLTSQPRHAERYSLSPRGMFVPRGRADRMCVVVDVRQSETASAADLFLPIKPGADFEALTILRALVRGLEIDASEAESVTGVSLSAWQALAERMKQARYGALFHGTGLTRGPAGQLNVEALLALVRDLNDHTRFIARAMRRGGNASGADEVLTWTTGYSFGINLARGYPRFGPGEFTAGLLLARREVDAALILMDDPYSALSSPAVDHLRTIPAIVIDWRQTETWQAANVAFRVGKPAVHVGGTVYRADAVPLPLRPSLACSGPTDVQVLAGLARRLAAHLGSPPQKAI